MQIEIHAYEFTVNFQTTVSDGGIVWAVCCKAADHPPPYPPLYH